MEYAEEQGIKSFPSLSSYLWHVLLLYTEKDLPEVVGKFDYDDETPRCTEFQKIKYGLRQICQTVSPGFLRMALDPEAFRLVNLEQIGRFKRHPRFDEAVRIMYERATKIPGFFRP